MWLTLAFDIWVSLQIQKAFSPCPTEGLSSRWFCCSPLPDCRDKNSAAAAQEVPMGHNVPEGQALPSTHLRQRRAGQMLESRCSPATQHWCCADPCWDDGSWVLCWPSCQDGVMKSLASMPCPCQTDLAPLLLLRRVFWEQLQKIWLHPQDNTQGLTLLTLNWVKIYSC